MEMPGGLMEMYITPTRKRRMNSANGGNIHAGIDHQFGGVVLHADDMPDAPDVFVQWHSNFGIWKYENGVLTINGTDNTGQKGDYVISIS